MITKYFLVVITVNQSDKVSQDITAYDTYKEAEGKWRDKLSQVGGNPQTKYAIFEVLDNYGRPMNTNYYIVDNREPEPEPTPEPETDGAE